MSDATLIRKGLRQRWPAKYDDGARCGAMLEVPPPELLKDPEERIALYAQVGRECLAVQELALAVPGWSA
jgi:hypothetical protein